MDIINPCKGKRSFNRCKSHHCSSGLNHVSKRIVANIALEEFEGDHLGMHAVSRNPVSLHGCFDEGWEIGLAVAGILEIDKGDALTEGACDGWREGFIAALGAHFGDQA